MRKEVSEMRWLGSTSAILRSGCEVNCDVTWSKAGLGRVLLFGAGASERAPNASGQSYLEQSISFSHFFWVLPLTRGLLSTSNS